jgi:hypothetical protein
MIVVIATCVGIVLGLCVSDVLYCMLRCRSTNVRLVSPKRAAAVCEELCLLVQRGGMTIDEARAYYKREVGVLREGMFYPFTWQVDLEVAWTRAAVSRWADREGRDDNDTWKWPGTDDHDDYNQEDEDNGLWTER